jgi:hypothetical protein
MRSLNQVFLIALSFMGSLWAFLQQDQLCQNEAVKQKIQVLQRSQYWKFTKYFFFYFLHIYNLLYKLSNKQICYKETREINKNKYCSIYHFLELHVFQLAQYDYPSYSKTIYIYICIKNVAKAPNRRCHFTILPFFIGHNKTLTFET